MQQHRLDREPQEQGDAERKLTPVGMTERGRDRRHDESSGHRRQIEHRCRRCMVAIAAPEQTGSPQRETEREGCTDPEQDFG
jgi:hypothetical protein